MIYCVTLNPALDNIIELNEKLIAGHKNRIVNKYIDVGGKGTHVSIALKILGEETVCTGIAGEDGYSKLSEKLTDFGVSPQFVLEKNNNVRNNYIITSTSDQSSFLITEKGFSMTKENIELLLTTYLSKVTKDDIVIIAGNPSSDTSEELFTYFFEKVVDTRAKIAVDLHGVYLKIALKYPIFFTKPNQFEFSEYVNEKINNLADVKQYLSNNNIDNIENLSISFGKEGSILFDKKEMYQFEGLNVKTVNDTGSGDAYFAGIIYGLIKSLKLEGIGRMATAIGAAKAEEKITSGFNLDRVNDLLEQVKYRKVEL